MKFSSISNLLLVVLIVLIQNINAVSLLTNDLHHHNNKELSGKNEESQRLIEKQFENEDDDSYIKRHVNNAGRYSNNHKMVNSIDFKKTMQHFLSQHGNQSILKKTKESELCKNVICKNVPSNGQIAKTWKLVQQASCCHKRPIKLLRI